MSPIYYAGITISLLLIVMLVAWVGILNDRVDRLEKKLERK